MFGLSRFELKITLLVLGIQFVTIVDFMMIMPRDPILRGNSAYALTPWD